MGTTHTGVLQGAPRQSTYRSKNPQPRFTGTASRWGGLYLQIRPNGALSWIYRFTLNGRTRDKGMGALAAASLMQARAKATEARALVAEGIDPIAATRAPTPPPAVCRRNSAPTFEEAAEAYIADKLKHLRSEIHRHQWRQTLQDYAYPLIGKKPVDEIGTADLLAVLRPIWEIKCETASRLRGCIERVLARATVEGHRTGSNPAAWRGRLAEALPAKSEVKPAVHHRAMEYSDVPSFMAELDLRAEVSATALKFLILTAARTGEVAAVQPMTTRRVAVVPLDMIACSLCMGAAARRNVGEFFAIG